MAKLHEVLAIKSGVSGKFNKLVADLVDLFTNKRHHFTKEIVVYKPLAEGAPEVKEKDVELQTTVRKELDWIGNDFAKLLDVCHQINVTNCVAKADVVIDGVKILENIPATGLLELEKYVQQFKALLEKIPTLDPMKGFKPDQTQGEHVYRAQDRVTNRTEKQLYALILAPATDKHPAQVSKESKDVLVGHKHESEWSGMLTPSEKSELLTRCEDFVAAIKEAQARANSVDVTAPKIGLQVKSFLLTGKHSK